MMYRRSALAIGRFSLCLVVLLFVLSHAETFGKKDLSHIRPKTYAQLLQAFREAQPRIVYETNTSADSAEMARSAQVGTTWRHHKPNENYWIMHKFSDGTVRSYLPAYFDMWVGGTAIIGTAFINSANIVSLDAAKITSGLIKAGIIDADSIQTGHIRSTIITADSITAGTLTGRTVQTDSTGDRVVMDGALNQLKFFNASGDSQIIMTTGSVIYSSTVTSVDDSVGMYAYREVSPSPQSLVLVGDADQNGRVDDVDAALVISHVLNPTILTGDSLNAADATGNGSISSLDASRILRWYKANAGLDSATVGILQTDGTRYTLVTPSVISSTGPNMVFSVTQKPGQTGIAMVGTSATSDISTVFSVDSIGNIISRGTFSIKNSTSTKFNVDNVGNLTASGGGFFTNRIQSDSVRITSTNGYTDITSQDHSGALYLRLPAVAGDTANFLQTDGSGTLTWAAPEHKIVWPFSSKTGGGTDYVPGAGYYNHATSTNDFNPSITWGTANKAEGAHFYIVSAGGAGGDTEITVTGTSFTDAGVRTTSDTEVLTILEAEAAGSYHETTKKWIGQVTVAKTSGADVLCNYGWAAYWDDDNHDFTITGILAGWRGGANDAACNISLIIHKTTGWTYNSGAAATPPTPEETLQGSYNTEYQTVLNEYHRWKLTPLSITVNGSDSEGVIVRFYASPAGKTYDSASFTVTYRE